jgi:hypothetical protein
MRRLCCQDSHKKKGWTEHQPKGIISYPANNNGNLLREERRGENNRSASSSLTDRQKGQRIIRLIIIKVFMGQNMLRTLLIAL